MQGSQLHWKFSLKVLFCKSKAGAERIYQAVSSGQVAFEATPGKFGKDINREGSGNLGVVSVGSLDPSLQKAIAETKPKSVSQPVSYKGNWLILFYEPAADSKAASGKLEGDALREAVYQQKAHKMF